ncbi:hypothetical protein A2954_05325 [Candidatus Roizmanbacteria bacterium RIFCSPLOWO2_01_FULL_37_12]|uniref:PIN domain-containing protein n=1 Tax=Candidatus Roizmanbacteria bacterium RIFCSPLOWO2_01_FULL_37_12 TaxID=1802056 RepID=A0A1F7IDF7_9BACT|nr:MAG: hypothetical protein A2768_00170 [Candidatus Roizmanbacteria bacterium RIFCSPHIGHO2_01_FULL_37_16]OGK41380.1 MAG: hypothetical protein A2954_05325 [Candidatus Roizmanbacteria bacterium RIFCSPLOWO2_01_FULL_37_12]
MFYVVDTHTFLWYLTDSLLLSRKARALFDLADKGKAIIVIPAIVILEAIDILDKKKIRFDFETLIAKIQVSNNFIFSDLNWSLIIEVNKLKGFKDLHDRVIIATAKVFDAHLISKDGLLRKSYVRTIW